MIVQPSIPGGHVTFCDDVRQEVTGKLLYLGVYTGDMVVPGPGPLTLGQVCAIVTLRLPVVEVVTPLSLRLTQSGRDEPLVRLDSDLDPAFVKGLSNVSPIATDEPEARTIPQIFTIMVAAGIEVTQDCVLRVRAFLGDDEVRLGSVRVRLAQPMESAD